MEPFEEKYFTHNMAISKVAPPRKIQTKKKTNKQQSRNHCIEPPSPVIDKDSTSCPFSLKFKFEAGPGNKKNPVKKFMNDTSDTCIP